MISSVHNPTVKRLRQLHERRGRAEQGLFLVEGVRLVEEAIDAGLTLDTVLVAPSTLRATARGRALYHRLLHRHGAAPLLEVSAAVLRHVADTETPSGVVATVSLPRGRNLDALPRHAGLIVVLDGVQDPGNAGTILRTALAAGADAVVAVEGSVDLFAPKVVRAGMGAHFRLPVITDVPAEQLLSWLPSRGQVIFADAHASASIYDIDLSKPSAIVVGGEAHGLTHVATLPGAVRARIPMPGSTESLNVASATAVILFEAVRQRRRD